MDRAVANDWSQYFGGLVEVARRNKCSGRRREAVALSSYWVIVGWSGVPDKLRRPQPRRGTLACAKKLVFRMCISSASKEGRALGEKRKSAARSARANSPDTRARCCFLGQGPPMVGGLSVTPRRFRPGTE